MPVLAGEHGKVLCWWINQLRRLVRLPTHEGNGANWSVRPTFLVKHFSAPLFRSDPPAHRKKKKLLKKSESTHLDRHLYI